FLITLNQDGDRLRSGKFLRAENINMDISNAEWKSVMYDKNKQTFAVPNGTIGHRWENNKTWNLHLKDSDNQLDGIDPLLSFVDDADEIDDVSFHEFMSFSNVTLTRIVPVKKVEVDGKDHYVTTAFDLLMAKCGASQNLDGETRITYEKDNTPYTPAWLEKLTAVTAGDVAQIAREFAQNAI